MGALECQNEPETLTYLLKDVSWHTAHSVAQQRAVHRLDLRNIDDGILREARDALGQEDVSWRVDESKVRSDADRNRGRDSGRIEAVGLYDEEGPRKPGLRPCRFTQVSPPDFSASDYHS